MKLWPTLLLAACFAASAHAAKPNIIFVLSDDLAMGDLGCYGQKLIQTPHLDRMAAEGTRYTQAYSGTSVCAPVATMRIACITRTSPGRRARAARGVRDRR